MAESASPPELPTLDFTTFLLSIIASAHVHLGEAQGPDGTVSVDLELAENDVDLLALLEEKTKGNLTGAEDRLLHHALLDLREKLERARLG
jgi:hypothetical protein